MNITVARMMILLVVTSILGLVSLAWLSQNRINDVYQKTNYANLNSVPSIVTLNKAIDALGRLRVRVYRHVLNTDARRMAEIEVKIKAAQDAVSNALKQYESEDLASDDKDKQFLAEDIVAYNDYLKGVDLALELSRQNNSEQARDVLTQYAEQAENVATSLKQHMEYNVDLAREKANAASLAKDDATRISTLIAAIILSITSVMGWLFARRLISQLDFTVEVASKVAAGDLSTDIQSTSKDEKHE